MHQLVMQGKVLYWGTSEWAAKDILAAQDFAVKNHLIPPMMEQPQYNLFHRQRVEQEYARLYEDIGMGLTTWSPLASGLLTGKYKSGVPDGSRGALESMAFLRDGLIDPAKNAAVAKLEPIAKDLGGTLAQLALAWVAKNPHVSSVITGASRVEQVAANLGALALLEKLTPEVMGRIDAVTSALAE